MGSARTRRRSGLFWPAVLFPLLVAWPLMAVGCGDDAAFGDSAQGSDGSGGGGAAPDPRGGPSDEPDPGVDEPEPEEPFVPEEEVDHRIQPPAASRSYVYVANTDLNAVARIDSVTLQIDTIEVGLEPTVVRTNPDSDRVVVLNSGSDDVSIIVDSPPDGGADSPPVGGRPARVDVTPGANSLVLASGGDFAIAYYDGSAAQPGDRIGSLNDATVIDLERAVAFNVVVGLNIREIELDESGMVAYFVTDDGLSVVDLPAVAGDVFVPPIPFSADRVDQVRATDREVEVTPDGRFALVRLSSDSILRLIDIPAGTVTALDLEAVPTDLDLLPSGESLVVVLRETGEVVVIPLPGGFSEPESIARYPLGDDTVVGLAQPIGEGDRVALYSTLNENDRLSLMNTADGTVDTFALRKGIESVHVSPDGSRLLVLHTKVPGEPVPGSDEFLARSFAYTVFDLETFASRLVITPSQPGDLVFTEDGQMAFMLLADVSREVMAVEWANLQTGRDTTIPLRRLPQAIGIIPATGRVFVAQQHEVGRMAFIDAQTGETREVTGYHLNSRTE